MCFAVYITYIHASLFMKQHSVTTAMCHDAEGGRKEGGRDGGREREGRRENRRERGWRWRGREGENGRRWSKKVERVGGKDKDGQKHVMEVHIT